MPHPPDAFVSQSSPVGAGQSFRGSADGERGKISARYHLLENDDPRALKAQRRSRLCFQGCWTRGTVSV